MKDNAGGDAQVVLILRAVTELVETGQQVIHLNGTNGEVVRDVNVHAAAERHRKRIIRRGKGQAVAAADVRYTKENRMQANTLRPSAS